MKIVRFLSDSNDVLYGALENETITLIEGDIFSNYKLTNKKISSAVKLLAPVCPGKIIAIGRNYKDHAKEMKAELPTEPLIFMKATSAVINPEDKIVLPQMSKRVEYEGELTIVIGKRAKNVPREEAKNYILGYTCANDVTARDLQQKDGQWIRAKSFDTFCPLGPCIATDIDPGNLAIQTRLNGEVKQSSNTKELIFPVDFLVNYISQVMTLFPGDIICTGTPAGVGEIHSGDKIEVEIEGIGTLVNYVA